MQKTPCLLPDQKVAEGLCCGSATRGAEKLGLQCSNLARPEDLPMPCCLKQSEWTKYTALELEKLDCWLPLGACESDDLRAQAFWAQLDTEHDLKAGVQSFLYCVRRRITVNSARDENCIDCR
jgi:hypothetical protein